MIMKPLITSTMAKQNPKTPVPNGPSQSPGQKSGKGRGNHPPKTTKK